MIFKLKDPLVFPDREEENLFVDILVDVLHFLPAIPEPNCNNPSDPKYSDYGYSDVECEYSLYFETKTKTDGLTRVIVPHNSVLYQLLEKEIIDECQKLHDNKDAVEYTTLADLTDV